MLQRQGTLTGESLERPDDSITHPYGTRNGLNPVPRFRLPASGMAADHAYNLIHDELMLDGNSRLNLATFVS